MTQPQKPAPAPGKRFPLLWLVVVLALLAAAGFVFRALRENPTPMPSADAVSGEKVAGGCSNFTASGLGWSVLEGKTGSGPSPTDSDVTLVNYRGTLLDGTEFDANQGSAFPVSQVVPGFSEGLKLMKKGGRYKLCIPPALGYGSTASGPIPANSVLVFEVDLLDFKGMDAIRGQ